MIGCIPWPVRPRKRGRPYVYTPTVILRCFIVRIWFRLDSNNGLHTFLDTDCQYNRKLVLACGLITIPSRRTFDRRLKTISTDIKVPAIAELGVSASGEVWAHAGRASPMSRIAESISLRRSAGARARNLRGVLFLITALCIPGAMQHTAPVFSGRLGRSASR